LQRDDQPEARRFWGVGMRRIHSRREIRFVNDPLRIIRVQRNEGTPLDGVRFSATALQRSPDESADILYLILLLLRHGPVFRKGLMGPMRSQDFFQKPAPLHRFIPPGGILPAPADCDGHWPVMPKVQNRFFHRASSSSVTFTVTIFASPFL